MQFCFSFLYILRYVTISKNVRHVVAASLALLEEYEDAPAILESLSRRNINFCPQ